jgi:hypothetical protein
MRRGSRVLGPGCTHRRHTLQREALISNCR